MFRVHDRGILTFPDTMLSSDDIYKFVSIQCAAREILKHVTAHVSSDNQISDTYVITNYNFDNVCIRRIAS